MTPSLEIREEAARLFEACDAAEEAYRAIEDEHGSAFAKLHDYDWVDAWTKYEAFTNIHHFRLLTDASRLYLRCAETNIPLCDTDECIETETGKLMIVKQAA